MKTKIRIVMASLVVCAAITAAYAKGTPAEYKLEAFDGGDCLDCITQQAICGVLLTGPICTCPGGVTAYLRTSGCTSVLRQE